MTPSSQIPASQIPASQADASRVTASLPIGSSAHGPWFNRSRLRWALAALLGLALLGGVTWQILRSIRSPGAEQATNPLIVKTMTVERASAYTVSRRYSGVINAGRTSDLGFEAGGKLVDVLVDRGERVEAGEPLARLDARRLGAERDRLVAQQDQAIAQLAELQNGPRREDIEAARATVQDLEDQLALEQLRQQRREGLYEEGAISREERDIVSFGAAALGDRLAAARSQLSELLAGTRPEQIAAQQAQVRQLAAQIDDVDIALEKRTLNAPFSGTIAARQQDEGSIVEAGRPVVRLVERVRPEVEVGLPADVVADLAPGDPQPIQVAGQNYAATLTAVLPELDPTTRTRTAVFSLEGALGRGLAPEQLAEVALDQMVSADGVWLPLTALTQAEKGLWTAYALASETSATGAEAGLGTPLEAGSAANAAPASETLALHRVEARALEVLHTEGDRVFVRGLLQTGDVVVADGVQRLVPGQLVSAEGER